MLCHADGRCLHLQRDARRHRCSCGCGSLWSFDALLEPSARIGGLSASGLSHSDIANASALGGVSREFFERVAAFYGEPNGTVEANLEPHVALRIFSQLVAEANVTLATRTGAVSRVYRNGGAIVSLQLDGGLNVSARTFIDASYNGDLTAAAGCSQTAMREANTTYNESRAGRLPDGFPSNVVLDIDPYGPDGSTLLVGMTGGDLASPGASDSTLQAYDFRLCVTDDPSNRVPFPAPRAYNSSDWELFRRYAASLPPPIQFDYFWFGVPGSGTLAAVPAGPPGGRKFDLNSDFRMSFDVLGGSVLWPWGDAATQAAVFDAHVQHTLGLLWTLAHDPFFSPEARANASMWGLCSDEFADTDHWPPQIYVREGRRLIGVHVLTQRDVLDDRAAWGNASVGLGCYPLDDHYHERIPCVYDADGGICHMRAPNAGPPPRGSRVGVVMEGHMGDGLGPFEVPYAALLPQVSEATNLLVPVALSASHVAFCATRLEPTWMVLGQSAGIAAALACQAAAPGQPGLVHGVDVNVLHGALLAADQRLHP